MKLRTDPAAERLGGGANPWPELPWREWEPTISTLHMWVQIVGKVRLQLAPPLNHLWQVALYVSARGLTTSPIPSGDTVFQVDFDFVDHLLRVTDGNPGSFTMTLEPKSVRAFYRELMAGLLGRGIEVSISTRPVEVAEAIPFDQDERHAAYDPEHAQLMWRAMVQVDRVMKSFQSGFVGKASLVNLFWGGFDLATSRYSGGPAPRHPGGVPNCPDWVMQEAESRQNYTAGWWPRTAAPGPAFYAYAYPEPEGFRTAAVRPAEASFDALAGEFILPYDVVRTAVDPDATLLEFLQSTYEASANLGGWDRAALEPTELPTRPLRRPWSLGRPRA
ncbi:MAG TPA: DUF5996 family protein [Candidatus Limnocylindrales bacterium]|nr:DUF5996 family protein [Candidatus Limnocylindrales bacterium]